MTMSYQRRSCTGSLDFVKGMPQQWHCAVMEWHHKGKAVMTAKQRILIVDDTHTNIRILNDLLKKEYNISIAMNGVDALAAANSNNRPDLILLDIMMPEMDGYEVCERLKYSVKTNNIPVLFISAKNDADDEMKGLELGAVDYITKPFRPPIVLSRVRNHMKSSFYQKHLEDTVSERAEQIRNGYIETIHRLTLASEYKDEDTGAHIKRISHYTRELAHQLGMDDNFCNAIFYASPMHDIGKVTIPDALLLKQGPLNETEWKIMKSHTTVGAKILEGSDSPYLQMAAEIALCHHERWDGRGYPAGLQGEAIPLTARIMNLADQYDALRSTRPYKPALDHPTVYKILTEGDGRTSPEHFDPDVLAAFRRVADSLNDIFLMNVDDKN